MKWADLPGPHSITFQYLELRVRPLLGDRNSSPSMLVIFCLREVIAERYSPNRDRSLLDASKALSYSVGVWIDHLVQLT